MRRDDQGALVTLLRRRLVVSWIIPVMLLLLLLQEERWMCWVRSVVGHMGRHRRLLLLEWIWMIVICSFLPSVAIWHLPIVSHGSKLQKVIIPSSRCAFETLAKATTLVLPRGSEV